MQLINLGLMVSKKQNPHCQRTGSITKLQKAMGHSSINVSLAYLRVISPPT